MTIQNKSFLSKISLFLYLASLWIIDGCIYFFYMPNRCSNWVPVCQLINLYHVAWAIINHYLNK